MKKILLVSHSQKMGGAERCLLEAAIGLREKGLEVIVVIPSTGELYEALQAHQINAVIISYPWWVHFRNEHFTLFTLLKKTASQVKYIRGLVKLVRRIDPDIILTNTLCIPGGAITAFLLRKKHYWFIHEFGKEDHGLIFDLGFYCSSKIISATSKAVLVNSEAIKNKFSRHIDKNKIAIINIAIATPIANIPQLQADGCIDLLLVGQISEPKGQADAIRALAILKDQGYCAKLFLVGQVADQDYYTMLQQLIKELKIQDAVTFISHIPNPYSVVTNFTIGLMCSASEAFGRVTIEYMKLGIPVVGAQAGTTTVLVGKDQHGLLYELRNPASLASQVERLIKDPALVIKLTKQAKNFADTNFSTEAYIGGLMNQLHGN